MSGFGFMLGPPVGGALYEASIMQFSIHLMIVVFIRIRAYFTAGVSQLAVLIYIWPVNNSSGVSHKDRSCILDRIYSDVSSNIPQKVYHI